MSRLRIRHVTGFSYSSDVTASYNEARMLPASEEGQLVLQSSLEIAPLSSEYAYVDYWGTRVSAFEILTPHSGLSLTATSLVEVRERDPQGPHLGWDELAAQAETRTEYVEQLAQSGRTQPPPDLLARAQELRADAPTPADAARAICTFVGERIQYMPGVTGVHTTAAEAWAHGKGVCQDITHLALGALRGVGIPARYVSGYLHPKASNGIGETIRGESHAWVEWWDGAWRGFDPTNRIGIGDRHVSVGRGRDYNDVPPLRGVYAGPGNSKLFVTVEITREG